MTTARDDIIARLGQLPSLPAVYHRVRACLDDPDGSLEEVAAIIETDAPMTARLLRVANSALYGLAGRVDNVLRALTIIGTEEAHHLVLSTAVISVFRDLPLGAVSMRSFWEHSIACGIAAKVIGRIGGRASPEHAYLAGLLHDVGRLPLFILEPHIMSAALQAHRDQQGHLHELEQTYFGLSHADVGEALLAAWQIPERFRNAAAHHHNPGHERPLSPETAAAHLADVVVNALRIGSSGTRWAPALSDDAWLASGLAVGDLAAVVETTVSTTRDVTAAFLEH